ncbi:MAG: T9SS type A sorting domain-containing protein [Chitinophagaceae bacterium]|nr:T9SS type A sorting domain-containing protein [Chitinophagaceae bacterium]
MRALLTVVLATFISFASFAAPGDTTWVQAHTIKQLGASPSNMDTMINFPDGTTKYRKIIMVFTLGKYVCPSGAVYCADWDYTVQTFAMNKLGDTVELGRLITPYGNGARMGATWSQPYYFDVTDFAGVLIDSNKIRIHYSGYSGGFTGDIKFAMIEGTPERNVLAVKKMWAGSFDFGNAAKPIDANVAVKSLTAPSGTVAATYRFNITGHGSDPNGCSEFCEKYYQVLKDGTLVKQKSIWRDNCGFNNLYPQNGTWIYNRGNWCPGAGVNTNFHPLPGITSGGTFDLSMAFEPYTSSGAASYIIFGNVIFYGSLNKTLDASMEQIIAPTNDENNFRENARIGFTTVKIRNTGSTTINNIQFQYGVTGQPLTTTNWVGTLASLTDTIIDLPFAESLLKATGTSQPYEVNILSVNGATDDDASNNKMTSTFIPAPAFTPTSVLYFRTNKSLTGAGFAETEWTITDLATNTVVMSRTNNAPETLYTDTLKLETGVYKLTFSDAGCDGLSWWANAAAGTGSIQLKPTTFTSYTFKGNFGGDFGCGFNQYFRVGSPTKINNISSNSDFAIQVYPNPANDIVNVIIEGKQVTAGKVLLIDNFGRVVMSQKIDNNNVIVNTNTLAVGVYTLKVFPDINLSHSIPQKLVIVK